jgi:hypothetical protein
MRCLLYFMYKQINCFDLKLKILFKFDIQTKTSHHFMFRFDIEMKSCILFKLCCARKKNKTAMFNKTVLDRQKERNIHFFMNESKKRIAFDHKKTKR